jgi:hypothetical protein
LALTYVLDLVAYVITSERADSSALDVLLTCGEGKYQLERGEGVVKRCVKTTMACEL